MAIIYPRKDSRFWWIKYVDAAGEPRQESTKLRRDLPGETRKARDLARELTGRELDRAQQPNRRIELWEAWVPRFIRQRYAGPDGEVLGRAGRPRRDGTRKHPARLAASLTRRRYEAAWRNISAYLRAKDILVPRQLTRQHIRDFIDWRSEPGRERPPGVHKAAKNTALLEIKFLGAVMTEAIASGFATHNPCLKLGIGRDQPQRKPKITQVEHRLITRMLKRKPEWMRVSYKIAFWQGCRFSETCLPLSQVDLTRNVLGLATKGEKKTIAEVPLSPWLRPMFRRLIRERRKRTFEMPKMPGKHWWQFFREIGLPHLCFHCTRVTFITRCYENGLSREDAMRLCLHASETVHQIYPRLPAQSAHLQQAMLRASRAA